MGIPPPQDGQAPPLTAAPPTLESVEQELQALTHEHARLRAELETRFARVREIEGRFLSLRPQVDPSTHQELKRRMILSRPWREELDAAYQALLATANELGAVTKRIHEAQLHAARLASRSQGPQFTAGAIRS